MLQNSLYSLEKLELRKKETHTTDDFKVDSANQLASKFHTTKFKTKIKHFRSKLDARLQ